MAVSYPLASPLQFGFASATFGPTANSARAKHPWTLADVVQVFDGRMWQGQLNFMPQTYLEARALTSWLTSLDGQKGTFLLGDPAGATPQGSAATTPGTPVVNGGSQSGSALAIAGLPASATGYLEAGDYLSLGSGASARLYKVLEQVDSDGSGEATVTIWPPLRSSPSDSDPVTVSNAQGVFAAAVDFLPWQIRQGLIHDGMTLPFQEYVG